MDRFLQGPNVAKIATVKPDGSPYVVPVWYEWGDGKLLFGGRKKSVWVEYIRKQPKIAVLIDGADPPYPKVIMEGEARILGGDWVEMGRRMVIRYFGPELGPSYLEGSLDQPRWVVQLLPSKITTWINPPAEQLEKHPYEAWHPRYYEPGTKWDAQHKRESGQMR